MAPYPSHFGKLRRVATTALYVDAFASVAACGYGAYLLNDDQTLLGLGFSAGGLAGLLLGILVYCQVVLLHKLVNTSMRNYEASLDAVDLLRRQADHSRAIAENTALSDWARKIVYREKDYEFLRDTIEGTIVRQDWEAAAHLIQELRESFGYQKEAAALEDELSRARRATEEEKIAAALERFETLCAARKWEQAGREVGRLRTLFPNEARITGLTDELQVRRQQYKRSLLKEYDAAVRTQNVDRALLLLHELDSYLAPNEAAALKDSARGVFKARLMQMGVQFSLAVSDKKFADAVAVGQELIREFPNSRYAHEIEEMLPVLRQRTQHEARYDAVPVAS